MIRTSAALCLFLSCLVPGARHAGAQQIALVERVEIEPKTKLEALQAQTGAVLIKGFSRIGTVSASQALEVTAVELIDAATGKRQTGVTVEIRGNGRPDPATDLSFIDYDKIDPLMSGIDAISKSSADLTRLDHFVASYKTRGWFKASTFNRPGSLEATVSLGYVKPATVPLSLQQLHEMRSLIAQAKQKLDPPK